MRIRHGVTLIEQVVVLTILGVLIAVVLRGAQGLRDQFAVRAAVTAAHDAFAFARGNAGATGARTAVRLDAGRGAITVHVGGDSLLRLPLAHVHGVWMASSRDSMAYLPSGLGYGAANLTVRIGRGNRADTITVSRLGRVK